MKLTANCVSCGSNGVDKKIGLFAPFISHRVMDYPAQNLQLGGKEIGPPILFTNAVRCQVCEFVFSQVRFEDTEMSKIYENYRDETYAQLRNTFEPGYSQLNPLIGKSLTEINARQVAMADFFENGRALSHMKIVLDYGGDSGQHIPKFFEDAEKYVYEVSSSTPLEGVKSITDLKDIPSVDFIMCSNVLEHIPYPREVLREIKQLCTKNTKIFIDVPLEIDAVNNFPSIFHEHINYFNEKSLRTMLNIEGFTVSKLNTYSMDFGWCQPKAVFALATPSWLH